MTADTQMTITWWSAFVPACLVYLATFIRIRRQKRIRNLGYYIFWYNKTNQLVIQQTRGNIYPPTEWAALWRS